MNKRSQLLKDAKWLLQHYNNSTPTETSDHYDEQVATILYIQMPFHNLSYLTNKQLQELITALQAALRYHN